LARGIFDIDKGIFATGQSSFFGVQLLGGVIIAIWAALLAFLFFYTIKLQNRLRISIISEIVGADFI
jgi:ammonia channel protein AmtB